MTTNPLLDALCSERVFAGGCDHCDAEQTMSRDRDGIYHLNVAHDDRCPWLASRMAVA